MHPSPPETRASLILRLQDADDVAAWEEFVSIYSPVIFRVAVSRGFQAADAQDIVQEVLLCVARSVSQWLERTDRGSFRAWLLRVARNQAFDLINDRATKSLGTGGQEAEQLLASVPANSDLSSVLDLEYERAVFQWAADQVRGLVADHTWQAFWLTRIEGLSVEEAASKLNLRPGNIYFARKSERFQESLIPPGQARSGKPRMNEGEGRVESAMVAASCLLRRGKPGRKHSR
ncbi:ECF RNA polymerase sigma factor SigE [Rubripirellula tenax]|uniref:ECF RNA polymerase sigma factor SigE n=1 Tax=Rubripirellula tenax TaxID=2528015 RepID=A0A5C6F6Z7_9BACT|nr:sigma-70 family RNA polymerase sigma factor [Rubripirellula tenax]TWU56732.1 ECF RNA polymerase sigma factor SigE [Rubripirellula tenax]